MEQPVEDLVGEQVATLGASLLENVDHLAAAMCEAIQTAIPLYNNDVISTQELRATCADNARFILGPLGRIPATTSPESRENGRKRAAAGVPLAAVMAAYRVGARYLWERLAETATRAGVGADVVLRAASEMWLVLDTFTQEMADGYRDEVTAQTLSHEEERSALAQALFDGHLADANLWEAADLLQLPSKGPYVVVAAQVPNVARHALPRIEAALRNVGIPSAWRLLHDVEIGVASLAPPGATLQRLADTVTQASVGCVGVSPPYDNLRGTPEAARLARIALLSAFDDQRVIMFDHDPLAIAPASAPEVMRRIAATTLAGLDQISTEERTVLLHTFGVWRDNRGSAKQAAQRLFVHPNTVRLRLHRLEQRTGRSLADPRAVGELSLAFEIDRRLAQPSDTKALDDSGGAC